MMIAAWIVVGISISLAASAAFGLFIYHYRGNVRIFKSEEQHVQARQALMYCIIIAILMFIFAGEHLY